MSSQHSSTNITWDSIDLKFRSPLFRFTFSEYLLHFYGYETYEQEELDHYYSDYKHIYFS